MEELSIPGVREATLELIRTYHEVNGPIDEYHDRAALADFSRNVRLNRPFVIRNGCSAWPAMQWDADHLRGKMQDRLVKVAETPFGNADSVVTQTHGTRLFVQPFETERPFSSFLSSLQAASIGEPKVQHLPSVIYSQAQNDNLRSEYLPLYEDVPRSIPEMTTLLDREPDAINFWLGNSASTTSLHRDNYENVYAQVCGAKIFVLLPPVEAACVNEQFLTCASYVRKDSWAIVPDAPEVKVPVAIWDPDRPEENATDFSILSQPLRVRLEAGDLLYLPACWYHKVLQENSPEGICCSVNYWYDMNFDGPFHSSMSFIRQLAWTATGTQAHDES